MAHAKKETPTTRPPRIFYGWYIVFVAFLGFFVNSGISSYGFGVIIKPMSEETGWSRSAIVGAGTLAALTSAAVSPWIGHMLDRHGARTVAVVSAVVAGASLFLLSSVQSLWQFYLLFGVVNGMARPGMSMLSGATAVANWFIRKRGRAMGLVATGISMAGVVLVPFIQWIIEQWGWRTAWVALGLVSWGLLILPSWFVIRRRPEDLGLLPDGDPPQAPRMETGLPRAAAVVPEPDWTAHDALRTRAFWLIMLAWGLGSLGTSSMFLLQTSSYADRGLSAASAALATSVFAFTGLVMKLVWGIVSERVHIRYCSIAYFAMSSAGVLMQLWVVDVPTAFLAAFLYGIPAGGSAQLSNQVWADYYGRKAVGAIRGNAMFFQVGGQATGPLFATGVFDLTGSYSLAFSVFAVTFLAAAGLMALALPPKPALQPVPVAAP